MVKYENTTEQLILKPD